MLREQNIEIEERRRYMEIVLQNVSAGVITLDAKGIVTTFNTSAEKMLNLKVDEILGRATACCSPVSTSIWPKRS